MTQITYLIYVLAWPAMMIGGSVYLCGWRGWSGWWVVLGYLYCSGMIGPKKWAKLMRGGQP